MIALSEGPARAGILFNYPDAAHISFVKDALVWFEEKQNNITSWVPGVTMGLEPAQSGHPWPPAASVVPGFPAGFSRSAGLLKIYEGGSTLDGDFILRDSP